MSGYRGYIGTRMEGGRSVPQSVQQLVIRDYCRRRGLPYLLAATEYRMAGSTLILDGVLDELDGLDGIVMYSLFLLPAARAVREAVVRRILERGRTLHLAAEGVVVASWDDAARLEDTWLVLDVLREQGPDLLETLAAWESSDARDQLPRDLSKPDPA